MATPDENGWLPMSSAPVNGTVVLLSFNGSIGLGYCEADWRGNEHWWVKAYVQTHRDGMTRILGTSLQTIPDGWQHLPKPFVGA